MSSNSCLLISSNLSNRRESGNWGERVSAHSGKLLRSLSPEHGNDEAVRESHALHCCFLDIGTDASTLELIAPAQPSLSLLHFCRRQPWQRSEPQALLSQYSTSHLQTRLPRRLRAPLLPSSKPGKRSDAGRQQCRLCNPLCRLCSPLSHAILPSYKP